MKRLLVGLALCLIAAGLYFAYRWAEPVPATAPRVRPHNLGRGGVLLTLQNAPFFGYANGRVTWTLNAALIQLQPLQGSGLANVSSATLTDIRKGALYELPSELSADKTQKPNNGAGEIPSTVADAARLAGKPAATFSAKQGKYTLGGAEPLSGDLAVYYFPQWQFRLSGGVTFQSSSGDVLTADSLTILELRHKQTQKLERRILCETGGKIRSKNAQFQANSARYDPQTRTVECLNGVRGTFQGGSVQTERLYWSLKEQTVDCPETTSGTLRETPFTAENLRLNLKDGTSEARHIRFLLRTDKQSELFGLAR
jgi:hypothetical protein